MKAMILAAGRGERMRPLSDSTPKPLMEVGGKKLIEYRLEALRAAQVYECVINLSYRAKQIRDFLGDGKRWGVSIQYSDEGDTPLESAGGIINALPLLGDNLFILINADIWTDYNISLLPNKLAGLAHLVMVNNPQHNPEGDFYLESGMLVSKAVQKFTYSGIGVFNPTLFKNRKPGRQALKPILLNAIEQKLASGEYYRGQWSDIGTPERLTEIQSITENSQHAS